MLPWTRYSNDRLLRMRIRDLGLTIEGTWLQECVDRLYVELDARLLRFKPHIWLSDDWFSPANIRVSPFPSIWRTLACAGWSTTSSWM